MALHFFRVRRVTPVVAPRLALVRRIYLGLTSQALACRSSATETKVRTIVGESGQGASRDVAFLCAPP